MIYITLSIILKKNSAGRNIPNKQVVVLGREIYDANSVNSGLHGFSWSTFNMWATANGQTQKNKDSHNYAPDCDTFTIFTS